MIVRYLIALTVIGAVLAGSGACAPSIKQGASMETVVILDTSQGEIVLRLFPADAPEHAKNFVAHSGSGFFDGTTFHRVIPGFVIQGGDPNSKDDDPANDGMGGYSYKGPGTNLPAEFNERLHLRGTLSMARAQDPNSAGSQFFICHGDTPFLDGQYTVFGEAIAGLKVVDKIVNADRDKRDRPHENQTILSARVEEWSVGKVEATRRDMLANEVNPTIQTSSPDTVTGVAVLFWQPHSLFQGRDR